MFPSTLQFFETGVCGTALFCLVFILSVYSYLQWRNKNDLNAWFFILLGIMSLLELPRFIDLMVTRTYSSRYAYCLHMIASGEFFFFAFSLLMYQWAQLLVVMPVAATNSSKFNRDITWWNDWYSLTRAMFSQYGLVCINVAFLIVDIAAVVYCSVWCKTLKQFFVSPFYTVLSLLEAMRNVIYAAILAYYGLKLMSKLKFVRVRRLKKDADAGVSARESSILSVVAVLPDEGNAAVGDEAGVHEPLIPELHQSYEAAPAHDPTAMSDGILGLSQSTDEAGVNDFSAARTTETEFFNASSKKQRRRRRTRGQMHQHTSSRLTRKQQEQLTVARGRVTRVLLFTSLCFALRISMMVVKVFYLRDSRAFRRSNNVGLFGFVWFAFAEFIPKFLLCMIFIVTLQRRSDQEQEQTSAASSTSRSATNERSRSGTNSADSSKTPLMVDDGGRGADADVVEDDGTVVTFFTTSTYRGHIRSDDTGTHMHTGAGARVGSTGEFSVDLYKWMMLLPMNDDAEGTGSGFHFSDHAARRRYAGELPDSSDDEEDDVEVDGDGGDCEGDEGYEHQGGDEVCGSEVDGDGRREGNGEANDKRRNSALVLL